MTSDLTIPLYGSSPFQHVKAFHHGGFSARHRPSFTISLPSDLDPRTRLYSTIIRDADKTDIFRVVATTPYEQLVGKGKSHFSYDPIVSEAVMACVLERRCVSRMIVKSKLENLITTCCMAFDLELEVTRQLVKEQGYLLQILESGIDTQVEQMGIAHRAGLA